MEKCEYELKIKSLKGDDDSNTGYFNDIEYLSTKIRKLYKILGNGARKWLQVSETFQYKSGGQFEFERSEIQVKILAYGRNWIVF